MTRPSSESHVLWQCFRHFVHIDKANAAIHCAQVRYSPLTFRLAELLHASEFYDELAPEPAEMLRSVIGDLGTYEEDSGR